MSSLSYALNCLCCLLSASLTSLRRFTPLLLVATCLVLLCPPTGFGQDNDDDVIRVNTDLIVFPIRIRDKNTKNPIPFSEKDLSLKDPDRVTSSLYFAAGTDRIALMFALDQSGSLREIVSQQRTAALELFSKFSNRSNVAVLRFSENAKVAVPFGQDFDAAKAAFDFPVARNRYTAIFDAAATAIDTFQSLPRSLGERRIVILISDGLDNFSRIKPDSIIRQAIEDQISFYVIHLPLFEPVDDRLQVRRPSKGFRELAEKTGGSYFLAGNVKNALSPVKNVDLGPVFAAIEQDLRSQYLVGFYVAEGARKGGLHKISIGMTRPGVTYSLGQYGYSKSHDFFVDFTPRKRN